MQGQRVVFTAKDQVEIQAFDIQPPKSGEILIRTQATLISPGTEGASLLALPNTSQTFPRGVGYSHVGIVEEVGPDVTDLSPGDRIASHAPHASHATTSAKRVEKIPETLSSAHATFAPLSAIAMQAVRKSRVELGESVLVLGQGIVGNLALQLARLQGGYPVIGADLDEHRLEFARVVGADHTIRVDQQNLTEATQEQTGKDGADVVIEATGAPEPIVSAIQAAAWCRRVVLLASTRGETESLNFYRDVHKRGLTIIGAHNSVRPTSDQTPGFWPLSKDIGLSLTLMAAHRLQVAPLITTHLPGNEAAEAFRLVTEKRREALGIILDWREAF